LRRLFGVKAWSLPLARGIGVNIGGIGRVAAGAARGVREVVPAFRTTAGSAAWPRVPSSWDPGRR